MAKACVNLVHLACINLSEVKQNASRAQTASFSQRRNKINVSNVHQEATPTRPTLHVSHLGQTAKCTMHLLPLKTLKVSLKFGFR